LIQLFVKMILWILERRYYLWSIYLILIPAR